MASCLYALFKSNDRPSNWMPLLYFKTSKSMAAMKSTECGFGDSAVWTVWFTSAWAQIINEAYFCWLLQTKSSADHRVMWQVTSLHGAQSPPKLNFLKRLAVYNFINFSVAWRRAFVEVQNPGGLHRRHQLLGSYLCWSESFLENSKRFHGECLRTHPSSSLNCRGGVVARLQAEIKPLEKIRKSRMPIWADATGTGRKARGADTATLPRARSHTGATSVQKDRGYPPPVPAEPYVTMWHWIISSLKLIK